MVKRSPGQIGSIPFKFSGMAKRSQDGTHEFVERALATPPKIQVRLWVSYEDCGRDKELICARGTCRLEPATLLLGLSTP